jgi:ankyrin repeat protein
MAAAGRLDTTPRSHKFLMCKGKMEASCQALMAVKQHSRHSNYSQGVPRGITGVHLAAYFGLETAARLVLGGIDPNMEDSDGRTPLWWAANNGHECFANMLLGIGI